MFFSKQAAFFKEAFLFVRFLKSTGIFKNFVENISHDFLRGRKESLLGKRQPEQGKKINLYPHLF